MTEKILEPEWIDRFDYGDGYVRIIEAPAAIAGATRYKHPDIHEALTRKSERYRVALEKIAKPALGGKEQQSIARQALQPADGGGVR